MLVRVPCHPFEYLFRHIGELAEHRMFQVHNKYPKMLIKLHTLALSVQAVGLVPARL